jgi:hypothetical protein
MFEKFSFWLNQLMDACHLNYIKNLKKKTTKSQEFSYFKNIYKDYPYI